MLLKQKVQFLLKTLDDLYPSLPIPLEHKDPYTLLIAVLLSAQSTDRRVNKVTPILFSKANTPKKMIKLPQEVIQNIIHSVGLSYTKSNNILNLSKIIIDKYNEKVPDNFHDLELLPGVGHKTASVVMAQAFNIPAFPVDTHIHRLLYRWGFSNGKNVIQTEKDAKRIFPKEKWNTLHLQIIWYGRQYSPARGWKLDKDIITQTIGRKKIIKKYKEKS